MLFTTMKTYSGKQFSKDLIAGIIVAIVALPLSIALALASGVGPEQGIYTAIVAGFVISFFGGSSVQIAGPTAAFATIVAGIVAKNGVGGLAVATVMAGIMLILMGIFKFGALIKFIPYTITTGFTSGIAVTIVIGQLKDFCGVYYPTGMPTIETMQKLKAFAAGITTFNPHAFLVGIICLLILILFPKITDKIPASLIAVIVGILMVKFLPLNVLTIGDLYTITPGLPKFTLPTFDLTLVRTVMPDAFTIAILAAIESLLSCVVADGMVGSKHRPNAELTAQGLGNIASALFGGIPATGAIARTAANVKSGGRTPVAGMVHAVVLVLVLVVLMPFAALIPMPTIAAILFIVAYNMCQWRTFVKLVKDAPKSDILVLVLTFVLTVAFDLVVAIEIGMIIACLLFIKRMSDVTNVISWRYVPEDADENTEEDDSLSEIEKAEKTQLRKLPVAIRVYEISGPMFFGAADCLENIKLKDVTKVLIIRMRGVQALDITALRAFKALYERCEAAGVKLLLSHVNEQPMHMIKKAGFDKIIGEDAFCKNIDTAIAVAEELVK